MSDLKLYRHPDHPGEWVGEDAARSLVRWPATPGGWAARTPFLGPRRQLEPAEPAEARGTRWPGAGAGRRPRAGGEASEVKRSIRTIRSESEEWIAAAKRAGVDFSTWARRELAAAARRRRP